jgi:hypothetical protein
MTTREKDAAIGTGVFNEVGKAKKQMSTEPDLNNHNLKEEKC